MFTRKSDHSWLKVGTAVVGGFLLGMSYKKYGRNLSHHWRNMKNNLQYNDFISNDDSDV